MPADKADERSFMKYTERAAHHFIESGRSQMILGVQFLVSDLSAAFEATDRLNTADQPADHRIVERVLLYGNWVR